MVISNVQYKDGDVSTNLLLIKESDKLCKPIILLFYLSSSPVPLKTDRFRETERRSTSIFGIFDALIVT